MYILKAAAEASEGIWNLRASTNPLAPSDFLVQSVDANSLSISIKPQGPDTATATATGQFTFTGTPKTGADVTGTIFSLNLFSNGVLSKTETWSAGADVQRVKTDFSYYLSQLSGDDYFEGSAKTASADKVQGSGGNDSFKGYGGDGLNQDYFFGGAGTDTSIYQGKVSDYVIKADKKIWDGLKADGSTVSGFTVKDGVTGRDGTDSLVEVERLQFTDKTINLTIQAKAAAAPQADVARLSELYIAFFNRIPDADGMSYWIDQMGAGKKITEIADSFYAAGVQYASLTGFSAGTTNTDFVKVIYKNVLGRSGTTAPPDVDVNNWVNNLTSGADSRGSLINTVLSAAHAYKGDATWGWVSNLLDNKITVAKSFAIDWGLNYNTTNDAITQGMAIANAVTSTDTTAAIALIGVNGSNLQLV
jgi:hypothetical protein